MGRWLSTLYGLDPPYALYVLGELLSLAGAIGALIMLLQLVAGYLKPKKKN